MDGDVCGVGVADLEGDDEAFRVRRGDVDGETDADVDDWSDSGNSSLDDSENDDDDEDDEWECTTGFVEARGS